MEIDISSILSKFAALDSAGESSNKIDTYLEYYKLGEYLNGNLKPVEIESYDNLDELQQKMLLNSYEEAKKYLHENCAKNDDCIQITEDNIDEYKKIYQNLYFKDVYEKMTDSELQDYDAIKKGLFEYCKNSQYSIDPEDTYDSLDYNFIIFQLENRKKIESEMNRNGQVVLDRIKNPYDNNLLKRAVDRRIAEENIQDLDPNKYTVDIGNGEYDKTAIQKNQLCWAHAGINVLYLTEEGRVLLESNKYYDPKTGVFAIHLQEAEDNGLHGGIYVITPDEIEAEGKTLSDGEGDVTVWMIALKRYFEEMQQRPDLMQKAEKKGQVIRDVDEGNAQFRFFEIITGAQASRQDLFFETRLQNGISYGRSDITFADISDIVSNQKGAAVICIGGHAISVVGVRDNKLLVQESNNSENLGKDFFDFNRKYSLFVRTDDINGRPTYELTDYDFAHYDFGEGVIKWK